MEIKFFLTFFLIYVYFIHWGGANENSRFFLTQSIVDESRLTIDSFYNYTVDRSFYQGHYYSDKEPGLSFLATPIYASWKFIYYYFFPNDFIQSHQPESGNFVYYFGVKRTPISFQINPGFFCLMSMIFITVFTSSLFSALTVVLVYKFTKFWTKKESHRIFTCFVAGFATLLFPYGQVFLDYGISTFFAFLPFYLIFKMSQEMRFNDKYLILAGVSSGLAITTSLMTLIIAIFCIFYIILNKKEKIHYFIFGLTLGVFPLLLYNLLIFGSPFFLPRFFLDKEVWEIPGRKRVVALPDLFMFYRITFDSYMGIFFYYPILLLFFLGIFYGYKSYKKESLLILFLILTYFILNSRWLVGSFFGPRHLTPISPFLVLPLVFVFQKSNKKVSSLILLLFLYSTFINFIGIAPPIDILEDKKIRIGIDPEFRDKIRSFEFLANPIYDYYLPMFLHNGARSRLFEDIVIGQVPDIRFLTPEKREFFYLFYPYTPFLSLLPISLICIIIWWNEIFANKRRKIIIKHKTKILLSFLFLIIFVASYYILSLPKDLTYDKGWFPLENGERWMGNSGTLLFYNKMGKKSVTLSFYARSYMKERKIQLYFNDFLIENFTVYPQTLKITQELNLKAGLNTIKLFSLDGCDIPNILENKEDLRCLSIAVQNLSLDILAEPRIILKQNFYLPEKNISWMIQDGKILIFNPENKTQKTMIRFNLKSFYVDRYVMLYLNDQMIDEFPVFKEGSNIYTPLVTLKEGENQLLLHSLEKCTKVADIAKNDDFRCFSIGISEIDLLSEDEIKNQNFTFIFGKGWYLKSEKENEIWMKDNGTIYFYSKMKQKVKFYFNFSTFIISRRVFFYLNNEMKNVFEIGELGGLVYTIPLDIKEGLNILEFSSKESCIIPAPIAKNEDYRCLSVGIRNLGMDSV